MGFSSGRQVVVVSLSGQHVGGGDSIELHASISLNLVDKIIKDSNLDIVARLGLIIADGSTELAEVAKGSG